MRKKKATLDDILKILNEIVKINLETLNYSKLILKQLSNNNNDESDKNNNDSDNSVMPIVDFRFGEQYYVNDFLQLNNPTLKAIVSKIAFNSNDEKVKAITEYIKKNYTYPFMMDGTPSCGGYFLRFQKDNRFKSWYWNAIRDYMWSFPVECAIQGYGICIDTSNLAFSLLRMLGVQAKVCLGAVYETKSGQLLGYHAWVEVPYKNETYVFETTIHPSGENLLPARVVYGKKMDVYYVKEAEYDEEEYREIQS